jgi:hypothetical protein
MRVSGGTLHRKRKDKNHHLSAAVECCNHFTIRTVDLRESEGRTSCQDVVIFDEPPWHRVFSVQLRLVWKIVYLGYRVLSHHWDRYAMEKYVNIDELIPTQSQPM